MEELSLVKQDINEKERDRLFHQIVQLEHEEDELRNLKKRGCFRIGNIPFLRREKSCYVEG